MSARQGTRNDLPPRADGSALTREAQSRAALPAGHPDTWGAISNQPWPAAAGRPKGGDMTPGYTAFLAAKAPVPQPCGFERVIPGLRCTVCDSTAVIAVRPGQDGERARPDVAWCLPCHPVLRAAVRS